jgi:hypothetical protein
MMMKPLSSKKEEFRFTQAVTHHEILQAFQDYLLINRLIKTNKKYFEVHKKALPVGIMPILGKKFLVHPLLLCEDYPLPDYSDWTDALHWTMKANMPLSIELRKVPVETLKAEASRLAQLIGHSKKHESLLMSIYHEQFNVVNTAICFLAKDEDEQKFRIRQENALKKTRKMIISK